MLVHVKKPVQVNAKKLKLHAKVTDQLSLMLYDDNGNLLKEHDGYVPGFMPGQHGGDYLMLDIDIDTGTITNWGKGLAKQIEEFIEEEEE